MGTQSTCNLCGTITRRVLVGCLEGGVQAALRGINAAVVGLLLAALYQPVWTSTIKNAYDFLFALAAFGLLVIWKLPPWMVVLLAALVGGLLSLL